MSLCTWARKDELRAQAAANEAGHGRAHAEAARHVVGRADHANAAHRHWLLLLFVEEGCWELVSVSIYSMQQQCPKKMLCSLNSLAASRSLGEVIASLTLCKNDLLQVQ